MTGICDPEIPEGFSYDYINAEVLMDAKVKDGKLLLKSGMEYSVLVLPKLKTMRPTLLSKIADLVRDGLTILGPAPEKSPSLAGYPEADQTVKSIAESVWQLSSQPFVTSVSYGKGKVYRGGSLEQVFSDKGIVADFKADDPALPIQFIHLTLKDGDVYFVSNQGDHPIEFDGMFRIGGKTPELWNPLTAETRLLPEYKALTKTTKIPMRLDAFESSFIVFRSDASATKVDGANYPLEKTLAEIAGPWKVEFQEGRGGPDSPVTFTRLSDWTGSSDPHIKYFSGTAVYTSDFKLKKVPEGPVYIDLGKVMVMARSRSTGNMRGECGQLLIA